MEEADWADLLQILHETVHIWSAGLSPSDYHRYLALQRSDLWFKKSCRVFIRRVNKRIQASCKLYNLTYQARGKIFRIAGIGAVYTQLSARNKGCATALLNDVLDLCEDEEFDGVVLYSAIEPDFYRAFGFEEFGSVDFEITEKDGDARAHEKGIFGGKDIVLETSEFIDRDVEYTFTHYQRWLRKQPFGVFRDHSYWLYKIKKESFLKKHTSFKSSPLILTKAEVKGSFAGYSITEKNGQNLRVLEVIGTEDARKSLWLDLLSQMRAGRIKRIRGWEAVVRDFAPTFKIRALGSEKNPEKNPEKNSEKNSESFLSNIQLTCCERDWGRGMILSLNQDLKNWVNENPCPLLEIDHL